MRILLGAFIFGIIGLFTFIGVMTPGMGWFLYLFLIPFWAMFPIVVVGVKGALLLSRRSTSSAFRSRSSCVRGTDWYAKAAKEMKTTGRTTIGGMVITSGGSSSGGSWVGGSSGGGFSGGGGSSGGGGASGSW